MPSNPTPSPSVSPYELAWIMHLEQVLPQRVWDALPDIPPPVFARIPPERWPRELKPFLAPYVVPHDQLDAA